MNLDDETLLTAYLDDELDAARRQEVEAAVRTYPHLEQHLADLKLARDLVASLPRPHAPADLSARVLERIGPRGRPRRLGGLLPSGPTLLAALSGLAAAAAILAAAILSFPHPPARPTAHTPAPTVGTLASAARPGSHDKEPRASNTVPITERLAPPRPRRRVGPGSLAGESPRPGPAGTTGHPESLFASNNGETSALGGGGGGGPVVENGPLGGTARGRLWVLWACMTG